MLVAFMLIIFVVGYAFIALEHKFNIDKTATAVFLGVTLWILYMSGAEHFVPLYSTEAFNQYLSSHPELTSASLTDQVRSYVVNVSIIEHVGDIAEIVFFLMGAMTIVELVDRHGGFNFVNKSISTRKSVRLLWLISLMTFFLSAVLDNLTTSIVMIMVLRKLISSEKERWIFATIIIIAANAGGAFSPIGDITTIMLWLNENITSMHTIKTLFIPSLVSLVIPLIIVSFMLRGKSVSTNNESMEDDSITLAINHHERVAIFCIGVGGLIFVPFFRAITGLPPFIGILGILSILWLYTELIYGKMKNVEETVKFRVAKVIKNIDLSTLLFFFGILMAVGALQEIGVLGHLADFLNKTFGNIYIIDTLIGILSSIVDNVPLVAAAMGMYPVELSPTNEFMTNFMVDGHFWQLLAYCAGTGGSLLIIGSAAGVVIMGLEKISFGWYLKRVTLIAFAGYIGGIVAYYIVSLF